MPKEGALSTIHAKRPEKIQDGFHHWRLYVKHLSSTKINDSRQLINRKRLKSFIERADNYPDRTPFPTNLTLLTNESNKQHHSEEGISRFQHLSRFWKKKKNLQ